MICLPPGYAVVDSQPAYVYECRSLLGSRKLELGLISSNGSYLRYPALVLADHSGLHWVQHMGDVRGKVAIRNAGDALQFLRLFTTPTVARTLADQLRIDVRSVSDLDDNAVRGRRRLLGWYRTVDNSRYFHGFEGIVCTSMAREMGAAPTVTRHGSSFLIDRLLLYNSARGPSVYRVLEKLDPDGKDVVLRRNRVRPPKGFAPSFGDPAMAL